MINNVQHSYEFEWHNFSIRVRKPIPLNVKFAYKRRRVYLAETLEIKFTFNVKHCANANDDKTVT